MSSSKISELELDIDFCNREMKACKIEMQAGIDYDANETDLHNLANRRDELGLSLATIRRRERGPID